MIENPCTCCEYTLMNDLIIALLYLCRQIKGAHLLTISQCGIFHYTGIFHCTEAFFIALSILLVTH